MRHKISPSMMCCDFFALRDQVATLERHHVDLLHIDVMDGSFVPNFALGTDFVRELKRHTGIPLDLHLMVERPEQVLELFEFGEGDHVSVHYEATRHLQGVLSAIKKRGARAFLAIDPATPAEVAIDVLDDIDGLLVMTVNPGFAGQRMVPHSIEKIERARRFLSEHGKPSHEIEVDGNVSIPNAILMREAGANIFVLGTAALFCGESIEKNLIRFKKEVLG